MSRKNLLIIGTILLIFSTLLNTTIIFFVSSKINRQISEQTELNSVILLTEVAKNRGVLQYELADNLFSFNNAFRLNTSDTTILNYFKQNQIKINKKVANAVITLWAGLNYVRKTSEEELAEVEILVNEGDDGYAKLEKLFQDTYLDYNEFRGGLVQDRDLVNEQIEYWTNIQHRSLIVSVFFQMIALTCFLFKDLKEKVTANTKSD